MQPHRTPKKPALQDWHKADIKAALEKAGYTFRGLAKARGLGSSYFTHPLHYPRPTAEAALAAVIGVPPQTIWPSRYEPDGTPKRGLARQLRETSTKPQPKPDLSLERADQGCNAKTPNGV